MNTKPIAWPHNGSMNIVQVERGPCVMCGARWSVAEVNRIVMPNLRHDTELVCHRALGGCGEEYSRACVDPDFDEANA